MLSKLGFKAKLLLLCLMLSAVSAIVGISNYFSFKYVVAEFDGVAEENMPNIRNSDRMFLSFRKIRSDYQTLAIPNLPKENAEEALKNIEAMKGEYEDANKKYLAVEFMPGEKEIYDKVDASWQKFEKMGDQILALYKTGRPEDQIAMQKILFGDLNEMGHVFNHEITTLVTFHEKLAAGRISAAEAASARANLISLFLILGGVLGGMAVGWLMAAGMSRDLNAISQGLSNGAEVVGQVAMQILNASEGLSASTSQQAAALQQTTAAIEETSAMIAKNAENAKTSSEVSEQSQATAAKGRQAVDDMLHSIEDISQSNAEIMHQIEQGNREISEIVKVIAEIGNKTKVINDIVFQTKLLSFNASVEAARAGEHGKGFAVVAEEVGNLAQMSGNSAKEISEMLEGSIKKVEMIVQNTQTRVGNLVQTGKDKVQAGTQTARRCSEILEEIVANVARVGSLVSEISVASQEQAKGVAEINKAMSELDSVAQQNSVASQEASTSAEELKGQVSGVRSMVVRLNELLTGSDGGARVREPARVQAPVPRHQERTSKGGKVLAFKANAKPTVASGPAHYHQKASGLDVPHADDSGFSES